MSLRRSTFIIALLSMTQIAWAATAVAPTYFGMHVNNLAHPAPTMQFGTLRLWDTGTGWADIEKSSATYTWTGLDKYITFAQSHNADIIYTFGKTPAWASSNPTLACNYGPGECAPPKNMGDWENYVRAIVTHSNGRIHHWEIWNEPNVAAFYSGDLPTLVEMARRAYPIIKSIDPTAIVTTPSPTWGTNSPQIWMDLYLTAGGGPYADVITFHGYPDANNDEQSIQTKITAMKSVMTAHGVAAKPLWDTEESWGKTPNYPDPDLEAAFLAHQYLLQKSFGVDRFWWYGWDYSPWGTLWTSTGPVTPASIAYQQVYNWMVGATEPSACTLTGTTWTCGLTRTGGYQAKAVWSTLASSTATFTVPTGFKQYRDLAGVTHAATVGATIAIGKKPILLESGTTVTTPICDVNRDGLTNVADVQMEINQALGKSACTIDINQDGKCNVLDVQRVSNAALGGACVATP